MMDIRPIKTDTDYNWALSEITKYFENEPEVGSPDGDRFDVLATLIAVYEDKHYPIETLDPVETIHAYMELHGIKQNDIAEIFGSRPRASEVLHRKRPLTLTMVHKLHNALNIPAEILIQPYHLHEPKAANNVGRWAKVAASKQAGASSAKKVAAAMLNVRPSATSRPKKRKAS